MPERMYDYSLLVLSLVLAWVCLLPACSSVVDVEGRPKLVVRR